MKTVKAWAIIDPKGRMMLEHIDYHESGAWAGLIPLWAYGKEQEFIRSLKEEGFISKQIKISEEHLLNIIWDAIPDAD